MSETLILAIAMLIFAMFVITIGILYKLFKLSLIEKFKKESKGNFRINIAKFKK